MDRHLLSICIPTYNRAKYLPACLDSIVSQFENPEVRNRVEIVIADNASTDNTQEIVQEYLKKYPNITYFRNEKNIGFDRSFSKLIDKSRGVYCLSIGDDDAFFDGVLYRVLEKIKDRKTPFVSLNCWGYDADLKEKVLPRPNLPISEDMYFDKLSDYVKSIKNYPSLVGIFVGLSNQLFERDRWVNFQGREKFFDTLAIHMYVNLSVFTESSFRIIAEPIVKTRSSNIRWDVFAGLETIQGRIKSTLKIAEWIRDIFKLPVSNMRLYTRIYVREYWFTSKEMMKSVLLRLKLEKVLHYYRKMRS